MNLKFLEYTFYKDVLFCFPLKDSTQLNLDQCGNIEKICIICNNGEIRSSKYLNSLNANNTLIHYYFYISTNFMSTKTQNFIYLENNFFIGVVDMRNYVPRYFN